MDLRQSSCIVLVLCKLDQLHDLRVDPVTINWNYLWTSSR
uniref:Uncharacterized protein n=1 Tax=Arundo donax TaxID=35708 RepID=A0A0A9ERE8_ARUDO